MQTTSKQTMRILEIETFGRGGLTHYAYNLSCELAARGHEVTLVTAAAFELDGLGTTSGVRLVKGIGRFSQGRGRTWPSWATRLARKPEAIADAVRVARLARRLRPDVVHLHCTNPIALLYVLLLRLAGVPLAVTAHVVTPHERIPLQSAVYRLLHRTSPLIIAHSAFDRDRLLAEFAIDPARTTVIPHGEYGFFARAANVPPPDRQRVRQQLGLGPTDEVALFFGYIREYKGLDLLLEAWETVRRERPRARLVIAGDPVRLPAARRTELEAWATRIGAHHHFDYVPFADVAGYFAAADTLVMPYRHISQSGVLYLALSLEVPVIATRVGALPEVLEDGESAVLVPPGSPDHLAEALIRVLGDDGFREQLAAGGTRVARAHAWPIIAARTEEAFTRHLR